jgi:dTDP-4-amino-4,6-dideoxygalactose transaminase
MWVRKRLDIGWSDLVLGLLACFRPGGGAAVRRELEDGWSPRGHALACLSVRSGFDLFLSAANLPRGSEVLISAITIPDMVRIIKDHGLVPVPIDLDPGPMAPQIELLRQAITPATRAILVAHLFGGRIPLEPLIELAKEHGLLVVEDCAQAFAGSQYPGHPEADVSMFSFGPIKTATALGGGVLRVRDAELLAGMRSRQAAYPAQGRFTYLRRLLKYGLLKALSPRPLFRIVVGACRMVGYDYDRMINGAVRGFAGPDFFPRIRRRPSVPLLRLLERRLRSYDWRRLAKRTAKGELLCRLLGQRVACAGTELAAHTHWVFPILADKPSSVVEGLQRAGFDATQGQSLCVVPPPDGRRQCQAHTADDLLASIVFLPLYPEIPNRELRRMARVVLQSPGKRRVCTAARPARATTTSAARPAG